MIRLFSAFHRMPYWNTAVPKFSNVGVNTKVGLATMS